MVVTKDENRNHPLLPLFSQIKINQHSVCFNNTLKCRILNFLLWPCNKFQLLKVFKPLEVSDLKRYAEKMTGLNDFGNKFHEISYEFFVKHANATNYSPMGYLLLHIFYRSLLVTKLRIVEEIKQDSMKEYMTANPIRKPIFIVGFSRTGTTFLQRLLALDPANTSPMTWELMNPVPRIKEDLDKDAKERIRKTQNNIDMFFSLVPQFRSAHEMGAELPEECSVLMGVDYPIHLFNFHSTIVETSMNEILGWNWSEAYTNYYRSLQIIRRYRSLRQGMPENRRWILKAPAHFSLLDQLIASFPDACIIWNHRDAKECLPSFASFIRVGKDAYSGSEVIKLDVLGKSILQYARTLYERGDKFFDSIDESSSYRAGHIMYEKLIQDPIGTIKRLYEDFGYEFTDEFESNIKAYLEEDSKTRNNMEGVQQKLHGYTLEQYGLTATEIDNEFGWYYEKYLNASKYEEISVR